MIDKDTKFIHKKIVFTIENFLIVRSLQDVYWQFHTLGGYLEDSGSFQFLVNNGYFIFDGIDWRSSKKLDSIVLDDNYPHNYRLDNCLN